MPPLNNPTPAEQISPDGIPIPAATPPPAPPPAPPTPSPEPTPAVEDTPSPNPEAPAKEEPTVDLTSFLEVKGETIDEPKEKPTVQPTPPEPPKEGEKAKTVTPKAPPAPIQNARDLSDLDADIAPVFKQMSNDAFNKLKPIVKEHKALKQTVAERDAKIKELEQGIVKVPENYFEHPQAFVLTPEFAEVSNELSKAQAIFKHWEKQLIDVRQGAKEYDFLYRDEKGQWGTRKLPADEKAETQLLTYFNFAQQQQMQMERELQGIVQGHQAKVQEYSGWAKNFEASAFPLFEKEEGKKQYQPIIEDTLKQFPPAYQRSPLAMMLAKSLVVNQFLADAIRKAQAGNGAPAAPAAQQQKAKAGPNASETGASGQPVVQTEVTVDDFEKIKGGY